jgi:ankyrin repeat protein
MLVLSRRNGESIVIDGGHCRNVARSKRQRCAPWDRAPKELPIRRSERDEGIRKNERTCAVPEKLDQRGRSQLHDAVIDHQGEQIVQLLAAGADVNLKDNGGWTPLHFAAQEQVVEIARMLLEAGAEVDAQDHFGNTPLWRAVSNYRGDGRFIMFLRQKAADAFVQNEEGVSPVALARRISNYDVANLFCDLDN